MLNMHKEWNENAYFTMYWKIFRQIQTIKRSQNVIFTNENSPQLLVIYKCRNLIHYELYFFNCGCLKRVATDLDIISDYD